MMWVPTACPTLQGSGYVWQSAYICVPVPCLLRLLTSTRLLCCVVLHSVFSLIARFMGPTWGPSGADRTHVGPMLAPWTLLSGLFTLVLVIPVWFNWFYSNHILQILLNWFTLIKFWLNQFYSAYIFQISHPSFIHCIFLIIYEFLTFHHIWGLIKVAVILKITFLIAFSSMKKFVLQLIFHWSLFLRVQLTISRPWFRYWFHTEQTPSPYLN